METSAPLDLGKKVFFLYPPSVVKADLVTRLLEREFEVYLLRDHAAMKRLLRVYPDSIVFINIDEGMTEGEWRTWIRELLADTVTAGVGVGILSYNSDEDLAGLYLMEIGARCGFVKMKLGAEASARILVDTLQANEAKGRRKFIRANCSNDKLATLNIRFPGGTTNGTLKDISVAGFSCVLDPDPKFMKNSKVSDIQLKLRGTLLSAEGIVFGKRTENEEGVYVVMFTNRLDDIGKAKIRKYIQISIQSEIDLQIQTS
ncbi:MAG: PilZ domain-containing protein [Treponemataceae bacterium]